MTLKQLVTATAALSLAAHSTVGAIDVKHDCVKRGNIVGVNKVNPGDPFDQQDFIADNNFDIDMQLTGLRSCLLADKPDHLSSFKLYWVRPDGTPLESTWLGPAEKEGDVCTDTTVSPQLLQESIKGGAIWYDVFDVQGVQLYYTNNDLITIGATEETDNTLERMTQTFGDKNRFAGFFGAQTAIEIQALGFLSQDPDCSEGLVDPGEVDSGHSETSSNTGEEEEKDDTNWSTILGVGFGIAAAAIIAAIICLVAKERNQTANKVQIIEQNQYGFERKESEMAGMREPSSVPVTNESDSEARDKEMYPAGDKDSYNQSKIHSKINLAEDESHIPTLRVAKRSLRNDEISE